jgi:hypothetical protein
MKLLQSPVTSSLLLVIILANKNKMQEETGKCLSLPPVQKFVRSNIQNNSFTLLFFWV